MKIAYITKQLPFGVSEAFILPEVAEHRAQGWDVWFVPLAIAPMWHDAALLEHTIVARTISSPILGAALCEMLRHPWPSLGLLARMLRARSPRLVLRNLAVFPKGLWLGRKLRRSGFDHIHIHFAAAPATMGVVAAHVAGLPYSITAHRYDITQNNLLAWKTQGAQFVRAIDAAGAAEIRSLVAAPLHHLSILHMGVAAPPSIAAARNGTLPALRLAVAARLVDKKGHAHLLDAIGVALARGQDITLDVFGDGPLGGALAAQGRRLGIAGVINWHGATAHTRLLTELRSGRFDAAILPSVTAADGDKEGIPVFLIEAMAAGLPVITTANGGIAELAGHGAGIMVAEGDVEALAAAMLRLARDSAERARLALAGRARVQAEFEITANMRRLRALIGA
jgi:colanic acid/amylovoran biosynthesis glycosyltransferase